MTVTIQRSPAFGVPLRVTVAVGAPVATVPAPDGVTVTDDVKPAAFVTMSTSALTDAANPPWPLTALRSPIATWFAVVSVARTV